MPDSAPLTKMLEATVPAQGTAGTAQDQVLGEVPFAGTVSGVSLTSEAAVAGNATNNRIFRLINKGQTGAGTTVVATLTTDASNSLVAFDEKAVPLSGTPANLLVAEGDVLAIDETVGGTGVAHAGYQVQVEISRS